jgi:cytochrome c oxidase cbb3-type subunit III
MSTGWSIFISVIVIGNIIGVMWLLFATSSKKGDSEGEVESTGHEWDGIKELNHPLPKWWFNMFILTTVFSVAYMYLYPALGSYEGSLGWTQLNQLEAEMDQNKANRSGFFSQFEGMDTAALQASAPAMKTASRLFANNCAQCHGSDAKGSKGFPNLADDDWLYGNTPEQVTQSILNGRQGVMPAFEQMLASADQQAVAQYVLSLSSQATDESKVAAGKAVFDIQCAACHMPDGTGNQLLGAPNLTDKTWLYGGLLRDIETSIAQGRSGKMPTHQHLFSQQEATVLAAYVLSL